MEPEVDFPRGGAGVLTALEIRDVKHQAKHDVLFKEEGEKGTTPNRPQAKEKGSSKPATPKRVVLHEFPSLKKLTVGTLLLCAVRDVRDFTLQVSLPFNIPATVHVTDISDRFKNFAQQEAESAVNEGDDTSITKLPSLDQLFHPGMLLPCSVTSIQGKHVSVSIDPAVVNANVTATSVKQGMVLSAWILSTEDHGYIVSFGLSSSKTGFLLNKNAQKFVKAYNSGKPLKAGQVIPCLILPGANSRSVPVTINPEEVQTALVSSSDHLLTINDIVPGLLVNATLKEITDHGLVFTIFGIFEAHTSIRHLPNSDYSTNGFIVKKKYKARVLWVDRTTVNIGLTLLPDIVKGIPQLPNMEIGDIIEEAVVVHVESSNALMLDLGDGTRGYSPISMVCEDRISKFSKQFAAGTSHPCRVVQFNYIDSAVVVSLQKSILERPFMTYGDITVGQLVSGTVLLHEPYGMLVQLTDYIRGLCPALHLADCRLKHPGKKLKVGKSVECRVLNVDAARKRLLLTHKKSLVESSFPLLTAYEDAQPGGMHHGVVTAVKEFGCLVKFFNNIQGIVRKSELSSQFIPDPNSAFTVGQVVHCKVLECDPTNEKLSLTLKMDVELEDSSEGGILPGQITDAMVTAVLPEGLSLRLLPSHQVAFLPLAHLSDHMEVCPFLLDIHREKLEFATTDAPYMLSDVMTVCPKLPSRPVLVTRKRSLLQLVDDVEDFTLITFSDLQPGMILNGFIKKCLPYGCFVEFVNNLVALAPNKYLKDEFVSDGSTVYKEGQTVRGKVMELDRDKQRFLVTLRCSDLQISKQSSSFSDWSKSLFTQFECYLAEREAVLENIANFKEKLFPGYHTEGTVVELKADEQLMILDLGNDLTGSAYCSNVEAYSEGDKVNCCIMEARQDGLVAVSISPQLVEEAIKLNEKKKKSVRGSGKTPKRRSLQLAELQSGNTVMVHVELVTSHYIMGTCTLLSGHVITYGLFDTGQMKIFPANMKFIKPGASVRATVYSPATSIGGEKIGPPVVMVSSAKDGGSFSVSHDFLNIKAGDIIDVIVKNVQSLQLDVRAGIMRGRVHITQILDNPLKIPADNPLSKYNSGDVVKARVILLRDNLITGLASKSGASTQLLELSVKPSVMASKGTTDFGYLLNPELTVGSSVDGFIKMVTRTHLVVSLTPSLTGEVPIFLLSTDPEVLASPSLYHNAGQAIHCTVVKTDGRLPILSLIGSCQQPLVGDVVIGQVKKIVPNEYLLICFSAGLLGRVDLTDISDEYNDDPLSSVKTYSIVKCCVVGVADGRTDLSLRESRLGDDSEIRDPEITCFSDLKMGQTVRGYIKSKTDVGFFVRLGRHVTGRVKIGNITDKYVKDFKSLYSVGSLVAAKVIDLQELEQKIELSLRKSDVNSKRKTARLKRKRRSTSDVVKKKRKTEELPEAEEEGDASVDVESVCSSSESSVEEDDEITIRPQHPRLATRVGFNWDTSETAPASGDSSDESEPMEEDIESSTKKKTKRQKRADRLAEEERLFRTEQALLDVNHAPQGPEDFDRLLMNSPNDSLLWTHYMAFYIHTTEIDKARAIGQRALQMISFREEKERLNIWVALLNLENLYGTQEAVLKMFDEALRQNEPIDVFFKLVTIYQNSEKYELSEQLYQTMTKKFKEVARVWTQYGLFLMKQGRPDAARRVLEKSLKAVPIKQHVDVIVKFSQYEFQHGDVERGRTMLESVLRNYPKRVDVWSVYIDLLIKHEDYEHVRELFERAIHLKLSSKRMKFFFKRYLTFEEQYGNEATVLAVKEKALAYVKSVT